MVTRQIDIQVPEKVLLAEKTDEASFARELRILRRSSCTSWDASRQGVLLTWRGCRAWSSYWSSAAIRYSPLRPSYRIWKAGKVDMALQVEPRISIKRHAVTLDEYERMIEAEVFAPEARLELIRGEILDMAPPGPEHDSAVSAIDQYLGEQLHRRAILWPQGNSVRLPNSKSQPQPDVTVLRWRDDRYRRQRPLPEDVILLVEVSDSSLKFDRGSKLRIYAEAGIAEYWIINLVDGVVEVYTDPSAGTYQSTRIAQRGETLPLPGGLEGSIEVRDIIGEELNPGTTPDA